ncbi:similar to Saccharomyces cerevisiae YJR076C CDC11 Component of the septin ring of the mother-bud neck that is required for cytokinesis [Maudiozyma saulgeensis]|uniref:Similar to Saccharomyces cerevisiae YJR076C CDC11 Component of the septin ring of the mother-bud neck that is required for cytokinesis n=1 Tax=Maudiozyma saulgeensis TaxID=1789683 RepID=A0A1X7R1Z8_9SACH|nr:similar to Saccharomyces cerevisiae YJR076C CDC11 Component of the septin ring of the mother-bud neck that is required for cytokinesis [Kazachstania saulgeensis]
MSGIIEASSALRKRKHLKRGINFTTMVVGQSGCGRSTFINTLCGQQVVDTSSTVLLPTDTSTEIELQLREETVELEDDEGVKIQLNIIDTPGFGDSLDNTSSFEVISDYIRHQYDEILLEESRVRRNPRFKDGRVHCCLYLISPTGHGLKEMDVEFIRKLGSLTNILPLIAKSDSLTPEELKLNKKLIMEDIDRYQLPIYNFPFDEDDVSQEDYDTNTYLRSALPFSIIGSNEVYDMGNSLMVRGRKYPWGMLDVEDATISDFAILRNALLISHLHDLKDYTHEILYERYRTEALSGESAPFPTSINNNNELVTSPMPHGDFQGKPMSPTLPSATASPAINGNVSAPRDTYLAREEQIRLEEERLKAFEERVQQELIMKRKELLQREQELREIEERLEKEANLKKETLE